MKCVMFVATVDGN